MPSLNNLIMPFIAVLFIACLGVIGWQWFGNLKLESTNKDLTTQNQNKDNAIQAYEQILKVLPFEVLNTERQGKANEEINSTIHDDGIIVDGVYGV